METCGGDARSGIKLFKDGHTHGFVLGDLFIYRVLETCGPRCALTCYCYDTRVRGRVCFYHNRSIQSIKAQRRRTAEDRSPQRQVWTPSNRLQLYMLVVWIITCPLFTMDIRTLHGFEATTLCVRECVDRCCGSPQPFIRILCRDYAGL